MFSDKMVIRNIAVFNRPCQREWAWLRVWPGGHCWLWLVSLPPAVGPVSHETDAVSLWRPAVSYSTGTPSVWGGVHVVICMSAYVSDCMNAIVCMCVQVCFCGMCISVCVCMYCLCTCVCVLMWCVCLWYAQYTLIIVIFCSRLYIYIYIY